MAQCFMIVQALCLILLMLLADIKVEGIAVSEEDHNYLTNLEQQADHVIEVKPNDGQTTVPTNWLKSENEKYQSYGPLKSLNIVKRAPNGFMGMRGKKDTPDSAIDWSIDPIQLQIDNDDSVGEWMRPKKTPAAFYGVRGKKYTPSGNLNQFKEVLHKLEENRVRDAILQDFLDTLTSNGVSDTEISKRAPTGFTGMRGKRPLVDMENDIEGNVENYMNKRGPTTAFVGVRGKKDVSRQQALQEQQEQLDQHELQQQLHQTFKRSPADSFSPRPKQQRFIDLSNKFVAVRGKKNDDATAPYDDSNQSNELTDDMFASTTRQRQFKQQNPTNEVRYFMNMLPSLLNNGNVGYKRTPGGFLGMRGKRPEAR